MKQAAMGKRRVTTAKFMGDDRASWAVFIDGRTFVTGLTRRELPYWKQRAYEYLGVAT